MSYTKTTWRNNQAPAINADNLNHMEQGIESAHNQIDVNTSNIESLTTQVQNNATNIASEISARQTTDSSLQSQIDQLVAPTGEAPNPAEIENARIGDDGVTYDTLGNAIRTQFSNVKSELTKLEAIASPIYEEINITLDSQAISKYCYYNAQYERIVLNNFNGASLFVFPISKGKTYRISGYGSDLESFPFAVVGDSDIVDSGASYANFIDVVEVGSSDRVYDEVDYYAQSDGYLYVNWYHRTAGDSATVKEINLVGYQAKKDGYGLYKSGNNYYYFNPDGDTNIIRLFTRRGINNLFQWNQILFGHFDNGQLEIDSSYNGFGTDIVGPISIWNGTLWPGQYGEWSGGNHGKTINGVEYATAEQIDFKCLVDGKEITEDGLYYGDVRFHTINKIYFPQSITGGDLSTATLSIIEHRYYHLANSKMNVRVWHEYVEATRVALYYGMQMVYSAFDHIFCANNNYYKELNTIVSPVDLNAKERKIIFSKAENGLCLEMSLADVGLGTYQINDGSGGYTTLLSYSIGKAYYDLIKNASNASIATGSNLLWEGTYDLYFG